MRLVFVLGLFACGARPADPSGIDWRTVSIEWSYGPCPADGRSCHQLVRVDRAGNVLTEESPALVKKSVLDASEKARLEVVLASPGFRSGMKDGFPCKESQDARIVIAFDGLAREVLTCVRGEGTNAPKTLVELLQKFRFVSPQP